jgi:hypothetical protein
LLAAFLLYSYFFPAAIILFLFVSAYLMAVGFGFGAAPASTGAAAGVEK